ncbi:PTS sugar transporter [Dickeya dianthicola]|uniref:PTS transporter subunit EIIC n=1 Tax=Dickeya dianthicola TaxID=204039 RepID=UPI00136F0581|nr:PTS transporter subunit EIIC [Dickeya dianthicola]MCI4238487.1 PTS transporter subunit EIIC [Dickeya dianthicola]MCI4256377.1 PTS transporter subunit EIIC [Dickeya dianthicola]MZG20612.1 PTS sugar transporter [Dickeya dianthicola]MZI88707.1 PTS sugar transporter [Dickeya dianthicola]QOL12907.1 PTS transporter subunit EIIC [Dickeya dianthicola]
MGKNEVVQSIIAMMGGAENINKVWHCMTRLRFDVINKENINIDTIKTLPGILGAQYQSEQFQIIIGPQVAEYYTLLTQNLSGNTARHTEPAATHPATKKGIVSLFMDTVSGVFGPIVPAIAGAGMIKGLLAGLLALKVIPTKTDTVIIIDLIASGVFYFLPFFLAISAARMFKTNEYLAAAIAACMMYPSLIDAAKALSSKAPNAIDSFYFIGLLPIPVFNYSASVIPVIFSILALSYIHRGVDRIMPAVLKTVFTPTLTLFITALVSLTIIGPLGIHFGKGLAWLIQGLFDLSSVLAGLVVGAIRPVAILTGMHHAMTPIALQNFAEKGYDMLMPMMCMANMAIAGSTFAIYFYEKTRQDKSVVLSAAVSALLGITEPALFGVLTKYKKAFLSATIASSIASAFIAFFGVRLFGYILSSVFSLPAYIGPYFVYAISGVLIALTLSFSLSYLLVVRQNR